jgi:hypothetical protein
VLEVLLQTRAVKSQARCSVWQHSRADQQSVHVVRTVEEWADRLVRMMDDRDPGVILTVTTLIMAMAHDHLLDRDRPSCAPACRPTPLQATPRGVYGRIAEGSKQLSSSRKCSKCFYKRDLQLPGLECDRQYWWEGDGRVSCERRAQIVDLANRIDDQADELGILVHEKGDCEITLGWNGSV